MQYNYTTFCFYLNFKIQITIPSTCPAAETLATTAQLYRNTGVIASKLQSGGSVTVEHTNQTPPWLTATFLCDILVYFSAFVANHAFKVIHNQNVTFGKLGNSHSVSACV